MLAVWRGGRRSSAGAREPGNEPSAYSPRPGWTQLSGGGKTHTSDQTKWKRTKSPFTSHQGSGRTLDSLIGFHPLCVHGGKTVLSLLFFSLEPVLSGSGRV